MLPVYINNVAVADAVFLHRCNRFSATDRRRENVEIEHVLPIFRLTICGVDRVAGIKLRIIFVQSFRTGRLVNDIR